jgi:16S rRNA (adenine1518-N6/adenine1519-N6)-dimethyltransferase
MTEDRTSEDASSISPTAPSRPSRRSAPGSAKSASPGSNGLTRTSLRALAARHDIRPDKALGQSFLADPNLARRIVSLGGVGADDRVLEIGAGLGSLTVALAATGAEIQAVEFDRGLIPALSEVLEPFPRVRVVQADVMKKDWKKTLGAGRWKMVSNLPYNVAVPLLMDMLEAGLPIDSYLVMVQREVGERLVAKPGTTAYGAVSVRTAYFASTKLLRRVVRTVFWPMPKVESVLVRLEPLLEPPVTAPRETLFRLIDEGFAQRRKTMRNALRRLGLSLASAEAVLEDASVGPQARAEQLGLEDFDRMVKAMETLDG